MSTPATHLRNRALLAAVIGRIEHDGTLDELYAADEPPTPGFVCWKQGVWQYLDFTTDRCGTAQCAAGYAIELAGRKWLVTVTAGGEVLMGGKPIDVSTARMHTGYVMADDSDPEDEVFTICGHRVVSVQRAALRLLGLSPQSVYEDGFPSNVEHPLFRSGNTVEDLRAWLDHIPE